MPANKLEILIQAKKDIAAIAETNRSLEALRRGLGDASKSARGLQADFSGLGSSVASSLTQIAAATAAIAGSAYLLKSLAASAVSAAAGFEQMRVTLDTLTRGEGAATFEELNAWALKMPVSTQKAIEAFTMLRAMGLKPTIADMTTIIDTTSALGGREDTLQGIARALGQMFTKGQASAQELRQLAEWGVPAYEILAEKLGMTANEIQNIGDTAISGSQAVKALLEGMAERFGGQSAKVQDTWAGLVETLVSYWKEFARQVMESGPFDFLKGRLKDLRDYLDEAFATGRFGEWSRAVADTVLSAFQGLIEGLTKVFNFIVDGIEVVHNLYQSSFVKDILDFLRDVGDYADKLDRMIPLLRRLTWGKEEGLITKPMPSLGAAEQAEQFERLRTSINAASSSLRQLLEQGRQALTLNIGKGFAGEVESAYRRRREELKAAVQDNIKAVESEAAAVKDAVDKEQKAYDDLYKKWQQIRVNQSKDAEKFAKTLKELSYEYMVESTRGRAEAEGTTAYAELARIAEREYYDRLKSAEETLAKARREELEGNHDLAKELAEEASQAARELPRLMDEAVQLERKAQEAGEVMWGPGLDYRDRLRALEDASRVVIEAADVSKRAWQEQESSAEEAVRKQQALLEPLKALWEDLKSRLQEYKRLLGTLSEEPVNLEIELANYEAVKSRLEELSQPRETVLTIRQQVITEQASRWGGLVGAFARGGMLPGWGGGDRIRALLEAGEYVIRKEAVRRYGIALFDALNNMRVRLPALGGFASPNIPKLAYATGGPVVSQPIRTVRLELGIGGKSFNLMSDEVIAEALERHLKRLSLTRRI
jgi:tape measure domain-containing protein